MRQGRAAGVEQVAAAGQLARGAQAVAAQVDFESKIEAKLKAVLSYFRFKR